MSEPAYPVQQFPPGWYPDPATPGRDRWWDGQASTRFTAKTVNPLSSMYPVGYLHSMRIGANRILIVPRILALIELFLFLFLIVGAASVITGRGELSEFVAVTAASVAACVTMVVCGIVGLGRAKRLGAKGVAIWAIASGGLFLVLTLLPLVVVVLATL